MIQGLNQPFRVHQFHYSVSPADGISHQMFLIQSALNKIGISGEIFASKLNHIHSPRAHKWDPERIWDCDLLLIHHSHGNPDLKKIARIEIPKAVIYHSITPAKFYPHDPFLADLSSLGIKQLKSLKHEVMASFAVSEFNASDLKQQNFPNPQILPLLDLSAELKETKSKKSLPKKEDPKNILFVGRLTRHKNQALLIKTFYYLKKGLPKNSKLFLVGTQDKIYTTYLKLLIRQLGLSNDVKLTGTITKKSLESYYDLADAFVSVSEHEGFCIPLVEAMSRHVPVFFLPKTGMKETMATSGVALHTEDPFEISQILAHVLANPSALKTILKSQHERLIELAQLQSAEQIQNKIVPLLHRLRSSSEFYFKKEVSLR